MRTFVYELGWGNISDCKYSTSGLRQAIAQVDHSLQNLWLDYIPGPAYFERIDDYVPIDSLATFSCLKNIKIGMYVLFGLEAGYKDTGLKNTEFETEEHDDIIDLARILPKSIETIYISHTNDRIRRLTRALELLLQQKESATPNLKRVAFEAYITGNSEEFDFERLDGLSEQARVRVDRIDGTALEFSTGSTGYGWEYSPGVNDRGQGMDGSLRWAAEVATAEDEDDPLYINAGRWRR